MGLIINLEITNLDGIGSYLADDLNFSKVKLVIQISSDAYKTLEKLLTERMIGLKPVFGDESLSTG